MNKSDRNPFREPVAEAIQPRIPSFSALDPIHDAHAFVSDLYEQIPAENKWKRLAMRKAMLNPKLISVEDAVWRQALVVMDEDASENARQVAGERVGEGMQYWKQLVIGKS